MRRQNIELKEAILKRMDEKHYNDMIRIMADDIYNKVEYDIVIFLARKCFNLYNAMLPLMREERDGLIEETHQRLIKKQGSREPIVLTDRAIDWVIWSICRSGADHSRGIRRILLVDDIIIHGRTLLRIKKKLKNTFRDAGIKEYKIDIVTFAANTDELLMGEEEISNLSNIRRCTISDWKLFSGQIVDVIYLMGQTYTSYVPKLRFQMDSEAGKAIRQFIAGENLHQINDSTRERVGVKTYVCVAEAQEKYKLCESYRIYEFSRQGEYVFVPMVSLQAVDEECLNRYIDSLLTFKNIIWCKEQGKDRIRKFLDNCSGEYKYRVVLYMTSAFAGWQFLRDRVGVREEDLDCYDREMEMFNFYYLGLESYSKLRKNQISFSDLSEKLEKDYDTMKLFKKEGHITDAMRDETVKALAEVLEKTIEECREKKADNDVIGKLFTVNNIIDEERYRNSVKKNEEDIQDRVMGIPLIDIVEMLRDKGRRSLTKALESVLKEIDYGKGSIVVHCFTCSTGKRWYTSLVHAGEENYRYYITYYLPVLYGLSMLEFRGKITPDITVKERFWDEFYKQNPEKKYLDSDKKHLLEKRTLEELKDVIEDAALYQPMTQAEREALNSAIKITEGYMK